MVGGGIAGSAAAWWLHHTGWNVVLVDASSAPHSGGFVLDLSATAQAILHKMDADHIVERTSFATPATALRFKGGRRPLQITFAGGENRLAHRGRLIEELLKHVPEEVDVRLGTRLVSLEHRAEQVLAKFAEDGEGPGEPFDIVVGADGVHSTVRGLVLSNTDASLYRNGLSHLWMTVDRAMPDPDAVVVGRHRAVVFAYPYPQTAKTQIVAAVQAPQNVTELRPLVEQVAKALYSTGRELEDIAEGVLASDDVLMTRFTQVRTSRWSARRVVLIGDAAHCIDPLSGLGAHGALLGAVTLAKSLQEHGADTAAAFTAYERHVRPFVQTSQRVTARAAEYVTLPTWRDRFMTVLGGAGELAQSLPRAVSASGRRALGGAADLAAVQRVRP
ncbi:NAD(P)/FAD-dependent oxidoreductase [Streptomyces sp. UH6]|uniref:FAD-dependent oxidoreductase n=1 Tax=Streptomyces sp. UH6 TaxID=2748379 RepID=UPI00280BF7D6|nr:NAD(P)/FAD-dependent oxidoreductase [Streptomyces sp. UH6]